MTHLNDAAERLAELLPADGTPRPNAVLREQLGLSEDEYWLVRDRLIDDGRVVKSRGQGGRTALAVDWNGNEPDRRDKPVTVLIWLCFFSAGVSLVLAAVFGYVWWGSEGLLSLVLTLLFGAVSIAAVGVSLLIYRFQARLDHSEAVGQARILSRLEALARQAATSSTDTRNMIGAMRPAVNALQQANPTIQTEPVVAAEQGEQPESAPQEEPIPDSQTQNVIRLEHGEYYRPGAVPLQVIGDLVAWWSNQDETARWPLSRLIGGYRQLNDAGSLKGVPWVITLDGGDGRFRSFRLAYSGRRKGPLVSELTEEGLWQDFPDTE